MRNTLKSIVLSTVLALTIGCMPPAYAGSRLEQLANSGLKATRGNRHGPQ
jgi:hypothetical protein